MFTVERQKDIARVVLKRLEIIDPNCILAGGAPRDWHFNTPARDLDFYICSRATSQRQAEEQLAKVGIHGTWLNKDNTEYNSVSGLRWVFESNCYTDLPFQVMFMEMPTYSVLASFCADISKAWWKGNLVNTTPEFDSAHRCKNMWLNPDNPPSDAWIDKMRERFPDYTVSVKTADQVLRDLLCLSRRLERRLERLEMDDESWETPF